MFYAILDTYTVSIVMIGAAIAIRLVFLCFKLEKKGRKAESKSVNNAVFVVYLFALCTMAPIKTTEVGAKNVLIKRLYSQSYYIPIYT